MTINYTFVSKLICIVNAVLLTTCKICSQHISIKIALIVNIAGEVSLGSGGFLFAR